MTPTLALVATNWNKTAAVALILLADPAAATAGVRKIQAHQPIRSS
jgi:hypothetical protein